MNKFRFERILYLISKKTFLCQFEQQKTMRSQLNERETSIKCVFEYISCLQKKWSNGSAHKGAMNKTSCFLDIVMREFTNILKLCV